jgi:hypothetical protein
MKKLIWLWKCFLGKKYFLIPVETGLEKDEILVIGHKIYFKK